MDHVRRHRRMSKFYANYYRVGISWVAQGVCGPAQSDKSTMFINELVSGLVSYMDSTSVLHFLLRLMVEYAAYVSDVLIRVVFRKICWDCELEDPQWDHDLHSFHSRFAHHLSAAVVEDVVDWSREEHTERFYSYIDPGVVAFLMHRGLITPRFAAVMRQHLETSMASKGCVTSSGLLEATDDDDVDEGVQLRSAVCHAREAEVLRLLSSYAA